MDDKTAMYYYSPIPKMVGKYYFDVKHGVSLSWVSPEDVASLLAVRGGCCGGQRQVVFLANDAQIQMYNTGDR